LEITYVSVAYAVMCSKC